MAINNTNLVTSTTIKILNCHINLSIMEVLLLCVLLSFGTVAYGLPNNCNKGPEYWCKNRDQAVECGVEEFCKLKFGNVIKENHKLTFHTADPAPTVKVDLYYESLCPGCRAFIMTQLFPTFQKLENSEIMEIGLYPYGNAEEYQQGEKWVFTCQHGATECALNVVEACALHQLGHPSVYMPYIHCLESNPSMANAEACASQLKIEWGPIGACYNGTQGNHLEHEIAAQTRSLNPPHQYVPWIVVDGQHTPEIQNAAQSNLLQFVCQKYTGVKPHACRAAETDNHGRCMKH